MKPSIEEKISCAMVCEKCSVFIISIILRVDII
jgi:hypothetical protein